MRSYTGSLETELIKSIVFIEDKRFYDHKGSDVYGKVGSILENIESWKIVRGGSTITEQYIKNTFYPYAKRTVLQKIREATLANRVEFSQSKESILRHYLDSLYLWNNTYGIAEIIESFGWEKNISHDDILDIITLIHTPSINENTQDENLIYRKNIEKKLGFHSVSTRLFEKRKKNSIDRFPGLTIRIIQAVKEYCSGNKDALNSWVEVSYKDPCKTNEIDMKLSLDTNLMEYAENSLEYILSPLEEKNVTNGAVFIYDGTQKKILAYISGRKSSKKWDTDIDMMTRRRSVGSILKPLIYLSALEKWYDGNEYILDDTRVYPTGYDGKSFVPKNYIEKSYGPVRLAEALGNSLNSSTVRLTEELGAANVYAYLRKKWLDFDHDVGYYGYSLVLGWPELTLENIVHTFAWVSIENTPESILLREILKDGENRRKTFGISSILGTSIPLPVKTGTSTDFRDNWAISYHPHATIGIWIGNSDNSPMNDVSGISGAWPLWHDIAEYMIARKLIPNEDTAMNEALSTISYCLDTYCQQRDIRLSRKNHTIDSFPRDSIYFERDFVTRMTEEEKKKWNILSE